MKKRARPTSHHVILYKKLVNKFDKNLLAVTIFATLVHCGSSYVKAKGNTNDEPSTGKCQRNILEESILVNSVPVLAVDVNVGVFRSRFLAKCHFY